MNEKEIEKLIEKGENQRAEFKKSLAEKNELLETVSAFANTEGGNIYVGVEENKDGSVKKIIEIKIKGRIIENLVNEIKQNTDPVIFPSVKVENIKDKKILLIEIQENPIKPVFAKGEVYRRVGRTNQKLSTLEIRELTRESIDYNFTEIICKECGIEDIDGEKIKKFIEKAKEERNFNVEYKSKKDFLKKMHIFTKKRLNYSAILLFGKDPQKFVLQSEVRCARFKGIKPLEFEDMEVINGTLIEQVERIMEFIKRNLKMEATFDKGIERKEKWEYPLLAIKEGVTNAICHRDFSSNANVQVRIFDDRLEIWNPGNLPKGLTVEKLKGKHESKPKNKLIANCFFLIKYIEHWGTGTNRMIEWCLKHGLPEPEFEDTKTSFIVTMRKDIFTEDYLKNLGLNERQINAVILVKKENKITNKKYQELFGVSRQTATRELSDITQKGVFRQVGVTGKGTFYTLVQTPHKRLKKGGWKMNKKLIDKNTLKTVGSTDNKRFLLNIGHSCQTSAKLVPKNPLNTKKTR